jgi:RHS repeat-associated protein
VAYVNRSDGDQYSVLAGQSIDDHLAVVHANGQIEYGLTDALNSTVATVDQGGARKGQFFYESFGQTTATGSAYPFQYAGRSPVSSTLYHNRARFYNSQTGRFISEDPIDLSGGDANLYRYVWNRPVSLVDPLGLEGWLSHSAAQGDTYALELWQNGWYGSALAVGSLSSLVKLSLFLDPLSEEINTLTDSCLTTGQKAANLALQIAFAGIGEEVASTLERPTSSFYALQKGLGWSHSTVTYLAWLQLRGARELISTGVEQFAKPFEQKCGCQ